MKIELEIFLLIKKNLRKNVSLQTNTLFSNLIKSTKLKYQNKKYLND